MKPYYEHGGIQIYHGDCLEIMPLFPSDSFEACITDPPYPKKYLHLYLDIASLLPRLLVRGGSFLAIVPHYAIPVVLESVGRYLKYRWLDSMWQEDGPHPRMAMGIEVMWKPIVWWVNEAWPMGRGFVRDGFRNRPPDKKFHEWEQESGWARFCLGYVPNGLPVIDPLMGSGTLLVEAYHLGYMAVGIDIDESCCETAAQRIDEAIDETSTS
jgi:DNA modification methylase